MSIKYFLITILLLLVYCTNAQEFKAFGLFGEGKPLKLTGGINTSAISNFSSDQMGASLNLVVGGAFNLNVNGIDLPFNFTFSNTHLSSSFQPIPLNRFTIHPKYKNFTLHLGTINKTFSEYSLNGFQFNGAAIDYEKSKLKLTFLGGKFLRGSGDYNANPLATPSYSRIGEGVSATYELKKDILIGANIFHAKDNLNSASNIPIEHLIFPKENIVSSINTIATITPQFKFSAEYANNLLTANLNDPIKYAGANSFSGLIHANNSTNKKGAFKSNVGYDFNIMKLGLEYERVDINYESLGSLYTINGFENALMTFSLPLLESKILIDSRIGIQSDLVDSAFTQKSGRLLTAVNFSYRVNKKLFFNGSINNNKTVTNIRNLNTIQTTNNLVPFYLDSLRFVQLNMNANLNGNYQLKATDDENSFLSGNYSYQKGGSKQGTYFLDEQGSVFHNANIALFTMYPKKNTRWSVSMDYTSITQGFASNNTKSYGVSFNFGKKLFDKKLNINIGSGYNTSYTPSNSLRVNVTNFKTSAGYTLFKKHIFSFNTIFQVLNRSSITLPMHARTFGFSSLNYNYNF